MCKRYGQSKQMDGWTPMMYTQGIFVKITSENRGKRLCNWLRHYTTNREVAGSIPDSVIRIFHDIILPAALWPWNQTLTEMSTRNISWGVKVAGA